MLLSLRGVVSGKLVFWAVKLDGGEQVLENQRQKGKVTPTIEREERREWTRPFVILRSGEKWGSCFQGYVVVENRQEESREVHPPSGAHTLIYTLSESRTYICTCRQRGHPVQTHKTRTHHKTPMQRNAFVLYTPNCTRTCMHTCTWVVSCTHSHTYNIKKALGKMSKCK